MLLLLLMFVYVGGDGGHVVVCVCCCWICCRLWSLLWLFVFVVRVGGCGDVLMLLFVLVVG